MQAMADIGQQTRPMHPDYHHIPPRQAQIDVMLTNWARWAKPRRNAWALQPMFRLYQSKARHWEIAPHIHTAINLVEALAVEHAVAVLPDMHRTAIRWAYVYPCQIHPGRIQRGLGVSAAGLAALLVDGRDMLKNTVKIKVVH